MAETQPELLLGLDLGTTSARALVCAPDGQVLGQARATLQTLYPGPGLAEQDATVVWQTALEVIQAALAAAQATPADLAALGIASQRTSIVLWQRASGVPVHNMVLWSDLRGVARAQELLELGFLTAPQSAVSKLEAVLAAVPDGRQQMARGELCWGTLESYLAFQLSAGSCHRSDLSCAWPTLYLDLAEPSKWNAALLDVQGLDPAMFPRLGDTMGLLGMTDAGVLGAAVPITALVADQQAGMLPQGAVSAGAWKLTLGTSGVLMACTGDQMLSPGPAFPPFVQQAQGSEVLYCTEGMVASAGSLFDWLANQLGVLPSAKDTDAVAATAQGPEGVHLLPALQFLGAPHNNFAATASINGLRAHHHRGHLVQAAIAGLAFRVQEIAAALRGMPELVLPDLLPVDGGAAASDLLCQALANQLQTQVQRHKVLECTALGAAMAAAMGLAAGGTRPFQPDQGQWRTRGQVFVPVISADQAAGEAETWRRAVYPPAEIS